MGVELDQLRALLAVVEHGSFTDAGIALGLSQAAVSRAVAGLESGLGVRVLRRTTRSVGLTRPWYVRHVYERVTTPNLRINHWS